MSQTWRLQAFRVRRGREMQMMTATTTTTNNLLHSLLHPVPIHCPQPRPPNPRLAGRHRRAADRRTENAEQRSVCVISCSAIIILIGPHETINTYDTAGLQHAPSSFWRLKRQLLFADHLVSSSPDAIHPLTLRKNEAKISEMYSAATSSCPVTAPDQSETSLFVCLRPFLYCQFALFLFKPSN